MTLLASSLSAQVTETEQTGLQAVDFNRDIRPVLSDNCFHCHGPDPKTREAGLRLDIETGLLGSDSSPGAVVAGDPEASELYQRIISDDPDLRMPPVGGHKQLDVAQQQLIHRWIKQGAAVTGHWSFQPVSQKTPLSTASPQTVSETIDLLVQQQRAARELSASPKAEPATLLRRLHFDLVGLPPTPEQVRTFQSDPSAAAYRQSVSSLLESPHYGERMAIGWLDLVRYADTVGYHGDQDVSVSPFRDYVIQAFNDNMPFDQFTIEQLAGDLLPEPTLKQKIASGYNRLGMMSAEGGVQPKEYLAKYIAERVRNVSGTWLGITMGCCECHDHKFDPFSTREFYQMEAFFADIKERGLYAGANRDGNWGPSIQVPTPEQSDQLAALAKQIASLETTLSTSTPELEQAQREWELNQPVWVNPSAITATSASETILTRQADASFLASGKSPATETYTITLEDPPANVTAIRLEVLPDPSLPKKGPGRASNGNFVLSEFSVSSGSESTESQPIAIQSARATYEQTGAANKHPDGRWSIASAIDGDQRGPSWGWAIMEQTGKPQAAVFLLKPGQAIPRQQPLVVQMHQRHDNGQHTIGRFRISITTSPINATQPLVHPTPIEKILATPNDQKSQEQRNQLAVYYRSVAPGLEPTRKRLADLKKQNAQLQSQVTTTLITEAVAPREIRVLGRGNWMDQTGEVVLPGFPATFENVSYQPAEKPRLDRLDLANWIVAPDHPLTARVFVNRIWKQLFGQGLSRNLDDFGAQGSPPSHPELLDYLARTFVESGWDVKFLIRSIVLSQTYQQSSLIPPKLEASDPTNQWLTRQNRYRLDAELVRDNALAVSGLLVSEIGGPSVKPYQPPGYWAYLNFPQRKWKNGTGDALYRRGLYTHWQRQYLHPGLMAFDASSREECTAQRNRSNTPLQSLVLLNDPSYVEAAQGLAERILKQPQKDVQQRLEYAFWLAVSRKPTAEEVKILQGLLQQANESYTAEPELTKALLSVGSRRPETDRFDEVELASWTSVARAILNLHETITRN